MWRWFGQRGDFVFVRLCVGALEQCLSAVGGLGALVKLFMDVTKVQPFDKFQLRV